MISQEGITMNKLMIFTAATLASGSAFAGEAAYVAPVIAPVAPVAAIVAPISDWSGMYVGGQLGMG